MVQKLVVIFEIAYFGSFWNIPTFEVTRTRRFLPCAEVGKISLRTLEGFDALELGNQLSFKLQPPCKLRIHMPDSTWRVQASNFEMHLYSHVLQYTKDVNAIVAERWTLWSGADSIEITLSWPGIWHVWTMTIHDIYQLCISMLDFIPQGIIIHSLNSLTYYCTPFVARILMNFGYITRIDPDVLPPGYWTVCYGKWPLEIDHSWWFTLWRCWFSITSNYQRVIYITGWWFGTWYIFPSIGKNNPNWLSYFSEGWLNHQPDRDVRFPVDENRSFPENSRTIDDNIL